ncbi:MAG: hypothetical protein E7Z63_01135 [Thermoplasmata archaeon]|nr:hypothetical protein [Thermoplasmata archaeon]
MKTYVPSPLPTEMEWNGRFYGPMSVISEEMYEDFIDMANYYGGGDLRDTPLWGNVIVHDKSSKYIPIPRMERGFYVNVRSDEAATFCRMNSGTYVFLGMYNPMDLLDWYDYKDAKLREAEKTRDTRKAFGILADLYKDPRNTDATPVGLAIADSKGIINALADYWAYVKWNEHGNEASLVELGGLDGFIDIVLDPEVVKDYLMPDGDDSDPDAVAIYDRLVACKQNFF